METTLRDKILICAECGNQFVYTIGQQRMAYQEGGAGDDPTFCPVCAVKIERMGRQPLDRAVETSEGEPLPYTNGHASYRQAPLASSNGNGHIVEWAKPPQPQPTPFEGVREKAEPAFSPNRPSDYRSGDEHPLYGHHGEEFLGYVKWFNDRKGFGFIVLDDGIEIFVHYSGIAGDGYKTLKQGQRVHLLVEDTTKGPQAAQVAPVEESVGAEGEPIASDDPIYLGDSNGQSER